MEGWRRGRDGGGGGVIILKGIYTLDRVRLGPRPSWEKRGPGISACT